MVRPAWDHVCRDAFRPGILKPNRAVGVVLSKKVGRERHNNRWLQRLVAEAVINVDICKPRLIRNGRGIMEKNNRGTTGAVRSDGRGLPIAHCFFVAFPIWRPGLAAVDPQRHRFKNLDLVHTDPLARLVLGRPNEADLQAQNLQLVAKSLLVSSLGAVNF